MWMGGCRNVREVLQYVVYVSNWKTIAYCHRLYFNVYTSDRSISSF